MKYHGNWWVSDLLDRLHTLSLSALQEVRFSTHWKNWDGSERGLPGVWYYYQCQTPCRPIGGSRCWGSYTFSGAKKRLCWSVSKEGLVLGYNNREIDKYHFNISTGIWWYGLFFRYEEYGLFFRYEGCGLFFRYEGYGLSFFVIPYFFSSERTFKSSYSPRGDFLLMIKSRSEPLQSQ